MAAIRGELVVPAGGATDREAGDDGRSDRAAVQSSALSWRHEAIREAGASLGMAGSYQPHITITWDKPEDLDIASVEPFRGALRFGRRSSRRSTKAGATI